MIEQFLTKLLRKLTRTHTFTCWRCGRTSRFSHSNKWIHLQCSCGTCYCRVKFNQVVGAGQVVTFDMIDWDDQ